MLPPWSPGEPPGESIGPQGTFPLEVLLGSTSAAVALQMQVQMWSSARILGFGRKLWETKVNGLP